jgi:hypothetical protein
MVVVGKLVKDDIICIVSRETVRLSFCTKADREADRVVRPVKVNCSHATQGDDAPCKPSEGRVAKEVERVLRTTVRTRKKFRQKIRVELVSVRFTTTFGTHFANIPKL